MTDFSDRASSHAASRSPIPDALIVGAGVIGLSCAWRLARRGLRVRVLDRDRPGSGASGVAAGMIAPVGEASWGEESALALSLASGERWPQFARELEEESDTQVGYRRRGALHVALDRDEAEELRRRHQLHRSLGLDAEWMLPGECRRLEPGLAPAAGPGVLAPGDAEADPRALIAALIAALDRLGVEILGGTEVCGGLFDGDRLVGVRTLDGGEHSAGTVVLAAGPWSGAMDWLPDGVVPAVRPVKGQILTLRGPAARPVCERIVVTQWVYLVPREDGRLVLGATVEEQGFDTRVTAGGVHELLREGYRVLPEIAELELVQASAGLRPGTPDNAPLIGHSSLKGLVLATGHWRNGILLAPITADAVVALLSGDRPPPAIGGVSPTRFERERIEVAT